MKYHETSRERKTSKESPQPLALMWQSLTAYNEGLTRTHCHLNQIGRLALFSKRSEYSFTLFSIRLPHHTAYLWVVALICPEAGQSDYFGVVWWSLLKFCVICGKCGERLYDVWYVSNYFMYFSLNVDSIDKVKIALNIWVFKFWLIIVVIKL